jgi:hypothetical protein
VLKRIAHGSLISLPANAPASTEIVGACSRYTARVAPAAACASGPIPRNRKHDQTLRVINVYSGFMLT